MATAIPNRVEEIGPVAADRFLPEIAARYRPVVMRGQAAEWPAVKAGRQGDAALVDYLKRLDAGKSIEVLIGPPEIEGRFFYDEPMQGCNFQKRFGSLGGLLDKLLSLKRVAHPNALYAGAAAAGEHLPGWSEQNRFPFPIPTAVPRIWIGNATRVSTHFDETSNVAIVVSGRRRFTLFPPEQLGNLYVGPFHFTIAGPPVSMVDLDHPDLEKYPRFAQAMEHALVADLEPGDAIFIPPIWWHNVKATAPFNVMMNYWWEAPDRTSPLSALIMAVLCIRDLPVEERRAWRQWFDHYVFGEDAPHAADHLPPHVQGALAPPSPERNAMLRENIARGLLGR